jgi:hypothetical protein
MENVGSGSGADAAPDEHVNAFTWVRRRRVQFLSQHAILRGFLFLPPRIPASMSRPPVVILSHGFSCTQNMGLLDTAEALCTRTGCAALTFDHKGFGESGGPRHQFCRWSQAVAYLDAITFLAQVEAFHVDADRVVLWGESSSSRLVIPAGAMDTRVGHFGVYGLQSLFPPYSGEQGNPLRCISIRPVAGESDHLGHSAVWAQ